MERFSPLVTPTEVPISQGFIRTAEWDRHNWTLIVEVSGAGHRLLQIPAYGKTPHVGDRIQLTGRNPLWSVQIEDVDVTLQQASRASEPLPLRLSKR